MSGITGKNTSTAFRKKDVAESRLLSIGFKKIRFMHKAAEGDTLIQLASLTTPTEATANGFAQPSISDLLKTDIYQYKENVELRSSLRGPLDQFLAYSITGPSTIKLLFEAEENEIFTGTIDLSARTGHTLVDAEPLVSTGSLLAGETDFNVGTPFKVGMFPNAQHGAVMVYLDNQLVYRNSGNNPPGDGVDGEYYEVHAGGGLGVIIRFNTPDLVNDRNVSIVSIGSLVERPNGSQLALVEALQGQVTTLREYVQALVGEEVTVPVSAPTNVDLKAFGDRVLTLERILDLPLPIKTNAVNGGPLEFSATTTAPTPGTVFVSNVWYDRDGEFANVRIEFRQTVAGTGGSGDYLFKMPDDLKINTNKVTPYTTVEGWNTAFISNNNVGGVQVGNGSNEADGIVVVYDADYVRFFVGDASTAQQGAIGSGGFGLVNAGAFYVAEFRVPIVGWNATQTVREALGL